MEPMCSLGNAFVVCEVIFRIDDFRKNPITINFAYYTKTKEQWNPNIHFVNQHGGLKPHREKECCMIRTIRAMSLTLSLLSLKRKLIARVVSARCSMRFYKKNYTTLQLIWRKTGNFQKLHKN